MPSDERIWGNRAMWAARPIGVRNVGSRDIFNRISGRCLPYRIVAGQPEKAVVAETSRCEKPFFSPRGHIAEVMAKPMAVLRHKDADLRGLDNSKVRANNSGT